MEDIGSVETLPPIDRIRSLLDELAALIRSIEAAQGTPGNMGDLIKANEAATRRIMDSIGAAINEIKASDLSPEAIAQVRQLVTSCLVPWSATSPLFYHIVHTPRDSFDDYEIVDLIMKNQPGGADVPGRILDRYYLNMVICSAFRQRMNQFVAHLAAETRRRAAETRPVRILNLHTGACHELGLLAWNADFARAVQVTCLATDAAALRHAKNLLRHFTTEPLFLRADPREFAAFPTWPHVPYDIIYAVNLFDQLSDRQTTKLITDCYQRLAPGGVLLFGNFQLTLPAHERILIDWLMNWNVRCRSDTGLRQLFARTWFGPECVRFESDRLAASQLVIAERR